MAIEPTTPTLVLIVGAPAVGKTTVGREVARLTGFPLFFNHQLVDLLTEYFPFGTDPFARMRRTFNESFFPEAAHAGLNLIATYGWAMDDPEDAAEVSTVANAFVNSGGRALVAELRAPFRIRLERNRSEYERLEKQTDWVTDDWLGRIDASVRFTSDGALPVDLPHLVLETADAAPAETARCIVDYFGLPNAG